MLFFLAKLLVSESRSQLLWFPPCYYSLAALAGDSFMSESDSDGEAVDAEQDDSEWASESEAGQ